MVPSFLTALLASASPSVGDVAPDFTVADTEGASLTLSQMVEKGSVIVAFFPKAFTSGCTRELTAYGSRYADIEHAGATVLAVSMDNVATLKRFKTELKASFHFVADPDGKLVKLFDAKMPVVPVASRVTYVIGSGRKVLAIQKGSDAIEPEGAVQACAMHRDGGTGNAAKK